MNPDNLYSTETIKNNSQFVRDLSEIVTRDGFTVHNESSMEMSHSFGKHGVEVSKDFDLHMIQLCKPEKAAKSLSANPERAILMPKFIMTHTDKGMTQIRFLRFSEENIRNVVDDDQFSASLTATYQKIVQMIEQAK